MNGAGIFLLLLPLLAFMIFNQRRRQRRSVQASAGISEGDEIMTRGGLYGTIRDVRDDSIDLEIARGVVVRFHRQAVAQIVTDHAAAAAVEAGSDVSEPVS